MSAAPGGDPAGFYAQPNPGLRAFGIVGAQPEVFCVDGDLWLQDPGGEALDIQPGEVDRLRLGVMATKSEVYHVARLFLRGQAEPLLLRPRTPRCPGYAATMRRFAHGVARERGLDRVERGLTARSAAITFLVVFAIAGGFSLLALLYWSQEHGMAGAIVFTAVMAGAVALFAWQALAREAQRPMRSLEEIDRYLPRSR